MPSGGIRTIRLFVSSTFDDMTAERDALQRGVFAPTGEQLASSPFDDMRTMCRTAGFAFEAIDLRWGISAAASESSATMERCLSEVRMACASPAPNFIALVGGRYGWRPPPARLPAHVMSDLLPRMDREGAALVARWYRVETNMVPATYVLRPELRSPPAEVERALHATLREAWSATGEPPPPELFASATEQEIRLALRDRSGGDSRTAALVYLREITGLPGRSRYRDVLPGGGADLVARDALRGLREELGADPRAAVRRYDLEWRGTEPATSTEYLLRFVGDVAADLGWRIQAAIQEADAGRDAREQEVHQDFAAERRRIFVGRAAEQAAVRDYLTARAAGPLIVSGPGGTGKSALLAWAGDAAAGEGADVYQRFVGISPEAGTGADLMPRLAAEITGTAPSGRAGDQTLAATLGRPPGRPTTIVIDGLDLLPPGDDLAAYRWLPDPWPPGLHVLLSSRDAEDAERLLRAFPTATVLSLGGLTADGAADLLDAFLADMNRQVAASQRAAVLAAFASDSRPLFVRLVADLAARWSDADAGNVGATDLEGVVQRVFDELATEERHGGVLGAAVALLAASRFGLSDGETHDALSADDAVVADYRDRHPDSPPIGGLPFISWSALRADLGPYLAARRVGGVELLDFFHLDLRQAAADRYLGPGQLQRTHARLAATFAARGTDATDNWMPRAGRPAGEAGHHLLEAGDVDGFDRLAGDARFLLAAAGPMEFTAGTSEPLPAPCADLIDQFARRAETHGSAEAGQRAGAAAGALRHAQELLSVRPQAAVQVIANAGDPALLSGFDPGGTTLTRVDRAPPPAPDHGIRITALALSDDGRWIAAGDVEGRVSWRSIDSTAPAWCVAGHEDWVTTIDISPDGRWIVSGSSEGGVLVWEAATSRRRALRFPPQWTTLPQVTGVAFQDAEGFLVTRYGGLYLVDLETDRLRPIPGVEGSFGVAMRGEADRQALARRRPWQALVYDGAAGAGLVVGDVRSGATLVDVRWPLGARSVAFDDRDRVLVSSADGLRLYDVTRPEDEPRRAPAPVFSSLGGGEDGSFAGVASVPGGYEVVLISADLDLETAFSFPRDQRRGAPHLVRACRTAEVAALGWDSGEITALDTAAGRVLSSSAASIRVIGGAIGTDADLAVGLVASRVPDEAVETLLVRPGDPPRLVPADHRDLLVGAGAIPGNQVATVDRAGHLAALAVDGQVDGFDLGEQPTAVATWRGGDGLAVGTPDGRAVLVGPSPVEIDFGATRSFGRVPVVALDARGDEPEVAVALHNGLSAWRRAGRIAWRPVRRDKTLRPTAIALLSDGLVGDGNEVGQVRLWSEVRDDPLLAWNAHVGAVVSISELADGHLVTVGAGGSVMVFDRDGRIAGGAMIEGGVAVAHVTDGSLVALRRDGWLVQYRIGGERPWA